ncbi:MAG: fibrobacter succinogenes major paralogous domain-containing protein [Paludibacter sp.]
MKLNHLLLVLCTVAVLFSCKNESEPQGELITVKLTTSFLQLGQDTDKPMLMKSAVDPSQVIYAIQVYENDVEYYYGLFDKTDSMKIALTTGKTYRFKVVSAKVSTGNGLKQVTESLGKYFYLPNKTLLENKFIKGNALKDINLVSNILLNNLTVKDYPQVDAFYCDKSILVEKGLSNIDFNLLRMGFSVTYNVDGLTNGKLYVSMGNDTSLMTSSTTTATSIHLFNIANSDFSSIFNNANTYGDSILVKAQWVGSNGTVLNTQGKFKFTRNYQKTINIQLNTIGLNLNFEGWANTVTDIDGNIYKTVTIGTQTWMAENLKVTHFKDGTAIPNITDGNQWIGLTTAGYCTYNNDSNNGIIYGNLYNWYSVNNIKNIAPDGWRVASDSEWTTLTTYLGGEGVAGGKIKEVGTNHWTTPNTGATNESGFNCLPIGSRDCANNGLFYQNLKISDFWCLSEYSTANAWRRSIAYDNKTVYRSYTSKSLGQAVRCIKN